MAPSDIVALVAVIVSGVVGIAGICGTVWGIRHQTRRQASERHAADLRTVAARALSAAWDMERHLLANAIFTHGDFGDLGDPVRREADAQAFTELRAYETASREFQLAADELELIGVQVTDEVAAVRDSLSLDLPADVVHRNARPSGEFEGLRHALRDRLRTELGNTAS